MRYRHHMMAAVLAVLLASGAAAPEAGVPESLARERAAAVRDLRYELDLQVPPAQSVPVLERLWADHPDATIHVFPGLNHLFQHARTGLVAEYATIEETFAPEALNRIGEWINRRFAAARPGPR